MDFAKYVNKEGNSLSISREQIDIEELVNFLRSRPHITKLSLMNCGVSDEDTRKLAKLTNLTSLDLHKNYISDKGARELAKLTNLTNPNYGLANKERSRNGGLFRLSRI